MATQAVLYVQDLGTMAEFYRRCLRLTPVETAEHYWGLRADSLVLWLVRGQQPRADGAAEGPRIRRRSEVPVKLAFEVPSIEQAGGAIDASGGSVKPSSWEFAGYRRRDATDPEGNVIQLLEPLGAAE